MVSLASFIHFSFIPKVLNCEAEGNTEKARKTAESILKYFSGFDAFSLPPPAYDSEVSCQVIGS